MAGGAGGLGGCIFVGHINTDTDRCVCGVDGWIGGWVCGCNACIDKITAAITTHNSVASAIGAAHLYGGTAARSDEGVNGEIAFALEYAGAIFVVLGLWFRERGSEVMVARLVEGGARCDFPCPGMVIFTLTNTQNTPGYKDWDAGGKGTETMPPHFPTIPGASDPFSSKRSILHCLPP